jgi:hypothetical protein
MLIQLDFDDLLKHVYGKLSICRNRITANMRISDMSDDIHIIGVLC